MMSRALLHNTVRLETIKPDGAHVGTGFFYAFTDEKRTSSIPVIVTCWHVVSSSAVGRIYFALGSSNAIARTQEHFTMQLPAFEKYWIRHPDASVDLAVMPLAPLMRTLERVGKNLDFAPIGPNLIPTAEELPKYGVFQEVKFIGYPIGIWDEKNNLPIVRRGMTATDPAIDYNGKSEFLVDAAVFPGSSGSPVFIANEGMNFFDGGLYSGSRVRFLGIMYAVHQFTSEGKVEIVAIPTAFDAKAKTLIPANLGLVVKAHRLAEFMTVFEELTKIQEKMANQGIEGTK
jgi:hypothetical protein